MSEIHVGSRAALSEGERLFVDVSGVEVGVFEHGGRLYAYENRCLHEGGPVCEGILIGRVEQVLDGDGLDRGQRFSDTETHLVCPWHGWEYDLDSGEAIADRGRKLTAYELKERGGEVYVVI